MTVTIADITVPPEDFELGHLVEDDPDTYVELERLVPLQEAVLPFLWIRDHSREAIEELLMSQPEVQSIKELTELDGRLLYRVEWTEDINGFVDSLMETNGVILEGFGSSRQWDFRIRFPEQVSLGEFNRRCEDKDIDVTLRSVYAPNANGGSESRLTSSQRETLLAAYELGFFNVPRSVTMSDLADHFDISEQAVSQRLRRGTANVVHDMLLETDNSA
jgi:predicted DNA binding protein